MHQLIVYSRKGCHLCKVVKVTLEQVQCDTEFRWHEVDIDTDPRLLQRFNDEVPVAFIDGRKSFKYRMDRKTVSSEVSGNSPRELGVLAALISS